MRLIATIFMVSMLAGCAAVGRDQRPSEPLPPSARPTYNLSGYPPAFKDGYIDGCETAKKTSYGHKDERRFAADSQYRAGWNDGFSLCQGKH